MLSKNTRAYARIRAHTRLGEFHPLYTREPSTFLPLTKGLAVVTQGQFLYEIEFHRTVWLGGFRLCSTVLALTMIPKAAPTTSKPPTTDTNIIADLEYRKPRERSSSS